MMFAIITPALITGAFANRVTFRAYVIFLIFWQLLVYYPFVHMIWGGGILAQWGVLDFAGGIVVHALAGFAALASVIYVGNRRVVNSKPNNIPLVAIGTALLWFGWYGFNAGSELAVNGITSIAYLNTDISGSFAAVTWLAIDWRHRKKAKNDRTNDRSCSRTCNNHTGCRICIVKSSCNYRNSFGYYMLACRIAEEQITMG